MISQQYEVRIINRSSKGSDDLDVLLTLRNAGFAELRSDANIERTTMYPKRELQVSDERGASLVEYALAICCISVLCIAAAVPVGNGVYTQAQKVQEVMGGACAGGSLDISCVSAKSNPVQDR